MALAVHCKKWYPSAAVAVMPIASWVLTVPEARVEVPPASGFAAIERAAVAGIDAKFAVTVASPDNMAVVAEAVASARLAFAVAVQFRNLYPSAGVASMSCAEPDPI